ncbi:hypothetical protein HMF8227_01365 [Saliniradius amylolyticus]|uniref:Flagellar Assembly Protein A N-terminal region domain-containing protein n=1 Tax=Saliniradius amylolyticus TaxID=2183582 RepID=A0A2S2E2I3_9ALTE|nr:FapA family protein [Saliniradius amylolyticus]AWL11843.1 hypothetical protein HMF8227_01365 [Saliniradius amylolyticus]
MNGVTLYLSNDKNELIMEIDTSKVTDEITVHGLEALIEQSDGAEFFRHKQQIQSLFQDYSKAKKDGASKSFKEAVAERRDAKMRFTIGEDNMEATVEVTSACGGKPISYTQLIQEAKRSGIQRGISRKRLKTLVKELQQASPGTTLSRVFAKGLPVRHGHDSLVKPLVPNALERILQPQEVSESRVDMRDLGDIICVKAGTPVLRQVPPSKGRAGYTVKNETVVPNVGNWVPLQPGDGTVVSPDDPHLLLAEISGMPKFRDGRMWVDDTYISKGVNVGTGNVSYNGAVIVNGDVTEKMIIKADGDVTINGFVESATIESGGDIIITQGAVGKQADHDSPEYGTRLVAQGSIFIQHGQGLDIWCGGNVNVGKQLAYSRVDAGGALTVGPVNNPSGNLFGCDIKCRDRVTAGVIGAKAGSVLSIDFSDGYNDLLERRDTLEEMLNTYERTHKRHRKKFNDLTKYRVPNSLQSKMERANKLFDDEKQLIKWMYLKIDHLKKGKDLYLESNARVVATKNIRAGVKVRLNNRNWKAERDFGTGQVLYIEHEWQYKPGS